jgi:hypothetical protein
MSPTIESGLNKSAQQEPAPVVESKDNVSSPSTDTPVKAPVFNHVSGKPADKTMVLGNTLYTKDNPNQWEYVQSIFFVSRGVTSLYGRKYTKGVIKFVAAIAKKLNVPVDALKGLDSIRYTVNMYDEVFRGDLAAVYQAAVVADSISAILDAHPEINRIKRDVKAGGSKPAGKDTPVSEDILDAELMEGITV